MSCKFAPSNKIMKKYRVKEENDKFSIEVEKITKNIFGKEKREWYDCDKNGDIFHYMTVGTIYRVNNWNQRLPEFDTLESAEATKKLFEKGIVYHE